MVRVNFFFETFPYEDLSCSVTRLKCGIQFKTQEGWTQPHSAIIDTGAHTSVIPSFLWNSLKSTILKENCFIFGLSKRKDCGLSGKMANVTVILIDERGNQTEEYIVAAFLAETDQVPLILGFNGLLDKLKMIINCPDYEAYAVS